jgi:hypothetical protein
VLSLHSHGLESSSLLPLNENTLEYVSLPPNITTFGFPDIPKSIFLRNVNSLHNPSDTACVKSRHKCEQLETLLDSVRSICSGDFFKNSLERDRSVRMSIN